MPQKTQSQDGSISNAVCQLSVHQYACCDFERQFLQVHLRSSVGINYWLEFMKISIYASSISRQNQEVYLDYFYIFGVDLSTAFKTYLLNLTV